MLESCPICAAGQLPNISLTRLSNQLLRELGETLSFICVEGSQHGCSRRRLRNAYRRARSLQPRSGWIAAARSTQPRRASATGKSSVFPSVCAPPALQIFDPVQGRPLQQSTLTRRPYKIAQKTPSWQSQSRSGNRSRRATPRLRR